jgi:hypothetical protein
LFQIFINFSVFYFRKENKAQTTRRIDSKIVNEALEQELLRLCNFPLNIDLKLLYSGRRYGFGAKQFHSKCDSIPNTLTIIRSSNGNIFGGYTQCSWDQSGIHKSDYAAFIFSLRNEESKPIKMRVTEPAYAIYCHSSFGPVFGKDGDIFIFNELVGKKNTSDLGSSYQHPTHLHQTSDSFLAGSREFQVSDIEVFQKL